ncbi:poly(hydroxyalkanoate) granule associated protein phasin [Variovorax sp. 54]|uniref:phasin family protein n=1 Tax=Variovorax sp. 54 TaxID=2035212 RepID=UPI000C1A0FF7|nr:phasin family protein [Variovorax sp. 54]PIF75249.1 poly(hydroxyalkanoate) granule associated protein phasin [Variovorax sp. 54]
MATRPDDTAKLKKRAAPAKKAPAAKKKAAPRKAAPAAKTPPADTAAAGTNKAEALLRAGLKALDNVRNDVAKRQANVIEGLLGIGQGKADAVGAKAALTRGFPSLDTFGIRKFEDVFDQRVATALQRLGMPSADEVQALRDEVTQLRERLAKLEKPSSSGSSSGKR